MRQKRKISLRDVFKFYREPHHLAALGILEEAIQDELLARDSDWIVCFFSEPDPKEPLTIEDMEQVRTSGRIQNRKD